MLCFVRRNTMADNGGNVMLSQTEIDKLVKKLEEEKEEQNR